MTPVSLDYLIFDHSDADDGHGSWDAMASVPASRWPDLAAEITTVLAWAGRSFPGAQAPLDEGGHWDYALQAQAEDGTPLALHFSPHPARLEHDGLPAQGRITACLTLSGDADFGEALTAAFTWD